MVGNQLVPCRSSREGLAIQNVYGVDSIKKKKNQPFTGGFLDFEVEVSLFDESRSWRSYLQKRRNGRVSETINQFGLKNGHRRVTQEVGISHGPIHAILSDDLKNET
ncbi:hypothetical protein CEXT_329261 [Caerostris extrusa]|uniref:Uncharacterized protein n=1 Tax=Caerostris extrusa TaxID=172846 RepID=A0AAV4U7R3_CAEEX|nr:hypothetical protein CEXT_329261 [Caerostris extrusa]